MCGINRFTRDERIDLIDRGLSTTSGLLAVAVLIGVPGVILVSWNIHGRRFVASDQAHAVVGIALATLIIGLLISGLVVAWWCKRPHMGTACRLDQLDIYAQTIAG